MHKTLEIQLQEKDAELRKLTAKITTLLDENSRLRGKSGLVAKEVHNRELVRELTGYTEGYESVDSTVDMYRESFNSSLEEACLFADTTIERYMGHPNASLVESFMAMGMTKQEAELAAKE